MHLSGWMLLGNPGRWIQGEWLVDSSGFLTENTEAQAVPEQALTGYFTPGFVDVHCHVGIGDTGPVSEAEQRNQMLQDLHSGVTLLRDCGSPVDNSVVAADLELPTLIRCGQHIAREKRYLRGLPRDVEPADLPEAMSEEAQRGTGWVKLVGDWIDRSMGADADLMPLWPTEALKEGVAAAHEAGARVVVHSFSHAAIDGLIEAGVDDIEHASGVDSDQLSEIIRRGIAITPTLNQIALFNDFADQAGTKFPVYASTMRSMWRGRREHAEMLFDSEAIILPGTDSGGYHPHGVLGNELRAWASIGVESSRILDLATWKAHEYLGQPGLELNSVATFVHFEEDPRNNASLWGNPTTVVMNGRIA